MSKNQTIEVLQVGSSAGPRLITGAVDPDGGAGVAAPVGSIYMQSTDGSVWKKFNTSDTDWHAVGTGGGTAGADGGAILQRFTHTVATAASQIDIDFTDEGILDMPDAAYQVFATLAGVTTLVNFDIPTANRTTTGLRIISSTAFVVGDKIDFILSDGGDDITANTQRFRVVAGTDFTAGTSDFTVTLPATRSDDTYVITASQATATNILGMHFPDSLPGDRTTTAFRVLTSANTTSGDEFDFVVADDVSGDGGSLSGGGGGAGSLDEAYDGGRTVTVDEGAVILDADVADTSPALQITREPAASAATAIDIVMGANTTGTAVTIVNNGTGPVIETSAGAAANPAYGFTTTAGLGIHDSSGVLSFDAGSARRAFVDTNGITVGTSSVATSFTTIKATHNARTLTTGASEKTLLIEESGSTTTFSSGTHVDLNAVHIVAPVFVDGGATVTNSASLYISGAPTGITPTNGPYAIQVAGGQVRLEGTGTANAIIMGTTGPSRIRHTTAGGGGLNIDTFLSSDTQFAAPVYTSVSGTGQGTLTMSASGDGFAFYRNVADANAVVTIENAHASSTGSVLEVLNNASGGLIMDAAGEIRIGLTSIPAAVAGSVGIRMDGNLRLGNSFQVAWGGGSAFLEGGTSGSDYIRLGTNNVEVVRITNAGLVGIGENDPDDLLHLKDTSGEPRTRYENATHVWSTGQTTTFFTVRDETNTNNAVTYFAGGGWQTQDNVAGVTVYVESATGDVGIGTSDPDDLFHVEGGDIRITSSGAIGALKFTSNAGDTVSNQIEFHNDFPSEVSMKFYTFDSSLQQRMMISGPGLVGIGETTPTQKLHIDGNLLFNGSTSGTVGLQPGATPAGDVIYTLPAADGMAGQSLTTDGAGVMSWTDAASEGGITQQFTYPVTGSEPDLSSIVVDFSAISGVSAMPDANYKAFVTMAGVTTLAALDISARTTTTVTVDSSVALTAGDDLDFLITQTGADLITGGAKTQRFRRIAGTDFTAGTSDFNVSLPSTRADDDYVILGAQSTATNILGMHFPDGLAGDRTTTQFRVLTSANTTSGDIFEFVVAGDIAGDGGADFTDGGEANGVDRTLGNTDNFSLAFKSNNIERLNIDAGGNVGIGTTTTTPNKALHVMAPSGVRSTAILTTNDWVSTTTGTQVSFLFGTASGNSWAEIQAATNGGNSGGDLVLQPAAGDVGIGVTSPNAKLHVAGDVNVYDTATDAQLSVTTSGNTTGAILRSNGDSGVVGQFGVGTLSPVETFQVGGDGIALIGERGTGTGSNYVELAYFNNAASRSWIMDSDTAAFGDFRISTQTTQGGSFDLPRFTIDPTGDVGIGTTTPLDKLHVAGNIRLEDVGAGDHSLLINDGNVAAGVTDFFPNKSVVVLRGIDGAKGGAELVGLGDGDDVAAVNTSLRLYGIFGGATPAPGVGIPAVTVLGAMKNGSTGVTALPDASTVFQVENNGTALLSVLGDGDVGMGVTVPQGKLEVADDSAAYGTEAGGFHVTNHTTSPFKSVQIGYDNTEDVGFIRAFHSATSVKPLVLNATGGNVGIGTENPASLFNVVRSTAGTLATFTHTSEVELLFKSALTPRRISIDANSTNHLILQSDGGNVGIGIDDPLDLLHINGTGGDIRFDDNATLKMDFAGTSYFSAINALGNLRFRTGGNSASEDRMSILANGNIGVGTTSPNSAFHISSADNTTLIMGETAVGVASSVRTLNVIDFKGLSTTSVERIFATIQVDSTDAANTSENGRVLFKTISAGTAATRMTINEDKIGIGTENPESALEIDGTDANSTRIYVTRQSSDTSGSAVIARKSRASLATVATADSIADFTTQGYGSSQWNNTSRIRTVAEGTVTGNNIPSRIEIYNNNSSGTLTERMRITNVGEFGLGTDSPAGQFDIRGDNTTDGGDAFIYFHRNSTDAISPTFFLQKSRGTKTSETTIVTGDSVGNFVFKGHDGTSYDTAATFKFISEGTIATGQIPCKMQIRLSDSAGAMQERMVLDSAGVLKINALATGTLSSSSGTITSSSDERIKNIHGHAPYGLESVKQINPVMFNFKFEPEGAPVNVGFVAQNVKAAIPEASVPGPDGMLGLENRGIIAALVNAVKELSAKVDDLQAQLDAKNSEGN